MIRFSIILSVLLFPAFAWRKYEDELVLSPPNDEGVYEFDLEIAPKLSMSTEHAYRSLEIHDYVPETMAWQERDKNQLKGCNESFTLIDEQEIALNNGSKKSYIDKVESMFSDLLQLSGKRVRVVSVNGNVPGPAIVVPFGAEVLIRIKNRLLLDSITLHFHGLDMAGTWYNDGVAYIQQCPIPVKSDYAIRFIADRIGTHWYHGQFPRHLANGLLGAFIVMPKNGESEFKQLTDEDITFQRDYVAILQDWPVQNSIDQEFNFYDNTYKWAYGFDRDDNKCTEYATWHELLDSDTLPVSAILINNKGWHNQGDILSRSSRLPLTTYKVKREENVRFRLIHGGFEQALMVHFESHRFQIIAADGVPVKPRTVDSLVLFPGERYDVLIQVTKEPARKVYRMVVRTEERFPNHFRNTTFLPIYGLANLEFEDVAMSESDDVDFAMERCKQSTSVQKCVILNCPFQPLPIKNEFACAAVDELEIDDRTGMERDVLGKRIHINGFEEHFISIDPNTDLDGHMFLPPKRPLHFGTNEQDYVPCEDKICNRLAGLAHGHPCSCFYFKRFRRGNIVQITFYNMGPVRGAHWKLISVHLHGTHFYVVKMGFPTYGEDYRVQAMNPDMPCRNLERGCIDLKWTNSTWMYGNIPGMRRYPSLRDTIIVPFGGYTVIRFRARNTGWWLAETQNVMYNDGGTKLAFAVGMDEEMPKSPEGMPLDCGGFVPDSHNLNM
ncbi:multicopper oxidase domain-containing protein [Ditylenchus destructor]|uniref:Multicopper oxidase domain-containing protein n=1 Tax=Ditylenchus destructor TaxID=166010 RepID=A0AAD4R5U9_9BILA|nr:multicopper oxidase domain-containing protein [Ditylenchus destructor]